MIVERIPEISKLTQQDKRLLINELWDDIEELDAGEPNPAVVRILQERWNEFEENPSAAMTLEEFRSRIGVS
jgi:putative addiction module component (TIGR02574 family)